MENPGKSDKLLKLQVVENTYSCLLRQAPKSLAVKQREDPVFPRIIFAEMTAPQQRFVTAHDTRDQHCEQSITLQLSSGRRLKVETFEPSSTAQLSTTNDLLPLDHEVDEIQNG